MKKEVNKKKRKKNISENEFDTDRLIKDIKGKQEEGIDSVFCIVKGKETTLCGIYGNPVEICATILASLEDEPDMKAIMKSMLDLSGGGSMVDALKNAKEMLAGLQRNYK